MSAQWYYDSLADQLIAVKWLFVIIMRSGEGKSVMVAWQPLHYDKTAVPFYYEHFLIILVSLKYYLQVNKYKFWGLTTDKC